MRVDKLLEKALFEFKERIEDSSLRFNISIEDKEIKRSYADYKKMTRVFHNLISNILKYSAKDSDVYIKLEQEESVDFSRGYYTRIIFKNTTEDEIKMNGEELLERFRRGESSINTEGSGLGLDIANSLMKLQNGELKINVDKNNFIVDVII